MCCCLPTKNVRNRKKKASNYAKHSATQRYGTNWESLVDKVQMSPSEINDEMISKEIVLGNKQYTDRKELIKFVLKDKYLLAEDMPIGKGAFGEVYKIREKATGEFKAVKLMILKGRSDVDRQRFKMFKNEVFSYRKVPHKNIIKLYDHFLIKDMLISFMVMEFAEGGDLLHRLREVYRTNNSGFSEKDSKTFFIQIANAMNLLHSKGLIHGDLKLENVLIAKTKDGKEVLKVSDFGCARVAFKEGGGVINATRALGTISYMAPEQLRVYMTLALKRPDLLKKPVKKYNPFRADVWALGVCLYRLIFFDQPFPYDHKNAIQSILKMLEQMKTGSEKPREISKQISKECIDLINNLLEYNKNKRIDMKVVMTHKWIFNSPDLDKNPIKQ